MLPNGELVVVIDYSGTVTDAGRWDETLNDRARDEHGVVLTRDEVPVRVLADYRSFNGDVPTLTYNESEELAWEVLSDGSERLRYYGVDTPRSMLQLLEDHGSECLVCSGTPTPDWGWHWSWRDDADSIAAGYLEEFQAKPSTDVAYGPEYPVGGPR
jgi:hypothetical protein